MTRPIQVDVAILGAGSAGMGAYRAARRHTDSIALIEADAYGTTCARAGCMPSKLLIAAAEAAHACRRAMVFGIQATAPAIDGEAVLARVRAERDRFVSFAVAAVESWPAAHRLQARARFIGPKQLQLDDGRQVAADRIVIATGSRPLVPVAWKRALGDRLVTSADIFEWKQLPQSVLVVGSGVVGLELGQALNRLGVRVRILARDRSLAGLTDPTVRDRARTIIAEDLPLVDSAQIHRLAREGKGIVAEYSRNDTVIVEHFDFLLAAMGRVPNLDGLGLESTELQLDALGVPISNASTTQAGNSHIFVAGDASGRRSLLHEAADEARIAGDNAGRFPDVRSRMRRAGLSVTFTDPQIAIAGRSYAELVASGEAFAAAEVDFFDQGRSRIMARNQGKLRAYADVASGLFLGAEMIAPDAEHLAHLLAWAAQAGLTVQEMLDSPFYHPVIEEGVRTALRLLKSQLNVAAPSLEHCLDC